MQLVTGAHWSRRRRSWGPWRWLALAVALLAGYGPSLCLAADSGNKLLSDCSEPPGQFGYAYCMGYVYGVGETSASGVFCPVKGITRGQAIDVVVHYLQAHPEIKHYEGSVLTQMALGQAFPCL